VHTNVSEEHAASVFMTENLRVRILSYNNKINFNPENGTKYSCEKLVYTDKTTLSHIQDYLNSYTLMYCIVV
jgi:hypothetical protein